MFKMGWYHRSKPSEANLGDTGAPLGTPWHEYMVEDDEAIAVATREVLSAWNGELKRWQEKNGYDGHPPDACLRAIEKSIAEKNPIGYTVYFIENAFRLEPVNA